MRTIFYILIISTILASTALSEDYYPLAKGNKWTYTMSNGVNVTVEVTGFSEINGIPCAVVESTAENFNEGMRDVSREYMTVDTTGLQTHMVQMQGQNFVYDPPLVRIRLPFRQGREWKSTINQDGSVTTTTFESVGTQIVTTVNGNVSCIVIRSRTNQVGQLPIITENYYADKVGLVLQRIQIGNQTIVSTMTSSAVKPTETITAAQIRQNEMQVICPNCGAKVPANAKFCTECGKEIKKTEDPNSIKETVIDVNDDKNFEQYLSPLGKVMLYKPQKWKVAERRLGSGANVVSVIRPDESALVVFVTFQSSQAISDSAGLAGICISAFKDDIPDLNCRNVKSTADKNQTVMDISYTEKGEKGIGKGYFFYTDKIGAAYLLLARDDVWEKLRPVLTNVACNIVYTPDSIENVIRQGVKLADKINIVIQEQTINPASILQKSKNNTGKEVELVSASLPDKSISMQIPKGWNLDGQEIQYLLVDDPNTKNRGLSSGLYTIIQSAITIPGMLNTGYQPPTQALGLILGFNRIGTDLEIIADIPGQQADQEIAKEIQLANFHGLQVDSRLLYVKFKSASNKKVLKGLFSVQSITTPMSPEWTVLIDGSWAPENEFDEWLPSYLQISKSSQIDSKWNQKEQQNRYYQLQRLNRNLQVSITQSGTVFSEYLSNSLNEIRGWDYTSWMKSQTTLAQGIWIANNNGAQVQQAESWGSESKSADGGNLVFNSVNFTGTSPWVAFEPEFINTQEEFEDFLIDY
jgi:ribosomal protein L40E